NTVWYLPLGLHLRQVGGVQPELVGVDALLGQELVDRSSGLPVPPHEQHDDCACGVPELVATNVVHDLLSTGLDGVHGLSPFRVGGCSSTIPRVIAANEK